MEFGHKAGRGPTRGGSGEICGERFAGAGLRRGYTTCLPHSPLLLVDQRPLSLEKHFGMALLISGDVTTRTYRECPIIEPQRRYVPHPGTEACCI